MLLMIWLKKKENVADNFKIFLSCMYDLFMYNNIKYRII